MQKRSQSEEMLYSGLVAGGAPVMWERIFKEVLPVMRMVANSCRVLEIGYGDGLLSCYFAKELKWQITGLDICRKSHAIAVENVRRFGLEDKIDFHCIKPEDTWQHKGQYDIVFIKTVLYNAPSLPEYGRWLDWILSVLKPGSFLINFETGKGNRMVQYYRRLRRRVYSNLCLYTPEVEALYNSRFEIVQRRYYGGWSQFLAPLPSLYGLLARVEEAVQQRRAGNCFAVSIVARKYEG